MSWRRIYGEIFRGKSLARALQNDASSAFFSDVKGKTLDLAGGSGSYYRFLPKGIDIVRTNLTSAGNDAAVDISMPLPYPDAFFDAVILFNALYVVPEPAKTLKEIHRVLAKNGTLYMATPYLVNEMKQPQDYWRFTSEGLTYLCSEAGFTNITLTPIGERFTAALYLFHIGPLRLIEILFAGPAIIADRFIPARIRREHPAPVVYLVKARKH